MAAIGDEPALMEVDPKVGKVAQSRSRSRSREARGDKADLVVRGGWLKTLVDRTLLGHGYLHLEIYAEVRISWKGVPSTPTLTAMRSTGQWYAQKATGDNGLGLGAPLPHIVITMLKFIVEEKNFSNVDKIEKKLTDWLDKVKTAQATLFSEIMDELPVQRVTKVFTEQNATHGNVYMCLFRVVDPELKTAFTEAWASQSPVRRVGMAPRNATIKRLFPSLMYP